MAIGLWAQLIGYIFIKINAHMQNKKVLSMAVSLSVLVNIAGNLLLYKKNSRHMVLEFSFVKWINIIFLLFDILRNY